MDQVAPQMCVLKLDVKCRDCQKKVKKLLKTVDGVHHVRVNSEDGKLTISSTVDPHILLEMFSKVAKNAHLLYEQSPVLNCQSNVNIENGTKKAQVAPCDAQFNGFDLYQGAQLAQLQELAKNQRLKQLELTQSRNIKMIFRDNDDFTHGDGHTMKINMDNLHNPPPPPAQVQAAGPSQCGGSTSTCPETKGTLCCHAFEFNCGGNRWFEEKVQRPILPPNYVPPPPPNYSPYTAPPPNYYASYGPPPPAAVYTDVNCGDEHKACTVM